VVAKLKIVLTTVFRRIAAKTIMRSEKWQWKHFARVTGHV